MNRLYYAEYRCLACESQNRCAEHDDESVVSWHSENWPVPYAAFIEEGKELWLWDESAGNHEEEMHAHVHMNVNKKDGRWMFFYNWEPAY